MSPPKVHFHHFGLRIRTLFFKDLKNKYRLELKLGRLALYKYYRGDGDPDPHDHPADFQTFPLSSYVESVYEPLSGKSFAQVVERWRFHYRAATHCHRVLGKWSGIVYDTALLPVVAPGPFWTIVWWGKEMREWGFRRRGIWVPWKEYVYGNDKTWAD